MRVLIAPDKFAGTLTAVQAAEAIAAGWRRHAPDDELDLAPMADGGPGFVDVLHAALGGELLAVTVRGPHGAPTPATFILDGATAYVARHHSVSRRNDVAIPTMPVSSSATQQPPGSVRTKCRVRSIQTARCGSERRSGAGSKLRCMRLSSSKKPSSLTRSAAGTSSSRIGRIVRSATRPR